MYGLLLFLYSYVTTHFFILPVASNPSNNSLDFKWRCLNLGSKSCGKDQEKIIRFCIGHFWVAPSLCFKTRLGWKLLIWKWFFLFSCKWNLLSQERSCTSVASFWKWVFLELGNVLFYCNGQLLKLLSFEKGCRKKCTRQSRKVLWVVLRSLLFVEILKEWHERPWTLFPSAYSVRNSVLVISHITFQDCRVHFFPTTSLEIAVYWIARNSLEKQKQRAATADLHGLELEVKIVKGMCQHNLIHLFSFATYRLWKFYYKALAKKLLLKWGNHSFRMSPAA